MLEVSNIADIVESVSNYVGRRGRGVCVLSGTGIVVNVTLKQLVGSRVVTWAVGSRFFPCQISKKPNLGALDLKKKKKKTKPLSLKLISPTKIFFFYF